MQEPSRGREFEESEPYEDRSAVRCHVDLEIAIAVGSSQGSAMGDQRSEHPARPRQAGRVPPPQMLAKSVPR